MKIFFLENFFLWVIVKNINFNSPQWGKNFKVLVNPSFCFTRKFLKKPFRTVFPEKTEKKKLIPPWGFFLFIFSNKLKKFPLSLKAALPKFVLNWRDFFSKRAFFLFIFWSIKKKMFGGLKKYKTWLF